MPMPRDPDEATRRALAATKRAMKNRNDQHERTATNTGKAADVLDQLLEGQADGVERDRKMLFWARVAGGLALLTLVVSVIALIVA